MSLALLLVICGIFLNAWFFSDQFTRSFNESVAFIIEMDDGTSGAVQQTIVAAVNALDAVVPGSVTVVSREQALENMVEQLGDEAVIEGMQNPFYDMIEFHLKAEAFARSDVESIAHSLSSLEGFRAIHQPRELFAEVFAVMARVRMYTLIIVMLALAIAGVLIHHIVRLNVAAQAGRIRTMELVGASSNFVRQPFVRLGRKMALQAWGTAVVLGLILWAALFGVKNVIGWSMSWAGLFSTAGLLVLAFLTCTISTYFAVNKSMGTTILIT